MHILRRRPLELLLLAPPRPSRAARPGADARSPPGYGRSTRSDGTYGVRGSPPSSAEDGERVNHKRVARVMRQHRNRRAAAAPPRTAPPIADPAAAKAPDLIGRDFTAEEPNTTYVGDITYLPARRAGSSCYLATVIDLASRRLAGWAIADHMRTDLVTDALAAAERTRGSLAGAIMHTDHGAQYTSRAFADACRRPASASR